MDELSVLLVLSLQLEDVDELVRGSKGKNPVGRPSDADTALTAYRDELLRNKMIMEDRRMGRSISDAVQRDGSTIAAVMVEEQNAAQDREVACRLGGVRVPKQITWNWFPEIEVDEEVLRRFSTINCSEDLEDSDEEVTRASSSKLVPSRDKGQWSPFQKQCVACQEKKHKFDTTEVPCTHTYCRGCISDLFEAAMTDESLFPPRCCRQEITLESVTTFLSAALLQRFRSKAVELKTPNRTYCVWPTCSTFIPTEMIAGDTATCPACEQKTCTICKTASHEGDCPNDTALQSLLTTAAANGWQRCYACNRMVELELGCNHMTYVSRITSLSMRAEIACSCICKAQFCYECGLRWKTCRCAEWSEERLLTRATGLVRRNDRGNAANEQQEIQRAADNLRERHECTHDSWSYVRGPHRCEECYHQLPQYIFECRQCHIQACNRCRRNRL